MIGKGLPGISIWLAFSAIATGDNPSSPSAEVPWRPPHMGSLRLSEAVLGARTRLFMSDARYQARRS